MGATLAKGLIWTVCGVALLVLIVGGLGVGALYLFDWNRLKPRIEAAAAEMLGRSVTVESLALDPGSKSTIRLNGLRIANPDWAEQDYFAVAEAVRIGIETWPLVTGQIELTEIVAVAPTINLERADHGRANWEFGKAAEISGELAAPETRDEFPTVGRLLVENGSLRYRDAVRGMMLDGEIATATGDAEGDDRVELSVNGSLEKKPLTIDFSGGAFTTLRETDKPFPVELHVAFAQTKLSVEGTMMEPLKMQGFDLDVSIQGPTLAELFPLLGIPLPDTPAYRLTGSLNRTGDVWHVTALDGKVGDSDLAGDLTLDRTPDPPFLQADLVSDKLDFADLAGFIGADPRHRDDDAAESAQDAEDGGIFPKGPVADKRLNAMNMDITLKAKQIIAQSLPIDDLSARLRLTDGRALLRPFELSVAQGSLSGELALNTRGAVPSADADLTFDQLSLKPFFQDTRFVQEMGGRFSGHLYLLGEGENLDQMMANARGQGWIGMRDGTISGLLIEAVGLDIAEALALAIEDDTRVRVRCGRVDLDAETGTVNAKRAIVDTVDSILLAEGEVNLGAETLDLQIEARPKDFSLIDMSAPVALSGNIKDPAISIGGLDPLPFLELGQAKDLDCGQLFAGQISPAEVEKQD